MFLPTMTDAEIQREARKDFFELSTKINIAADRFMRVHRNMLDNSTLTRNDNPLCLLTRTVEYKKWVTRKRNTWTSCFMFRNEVSADSIQIVCFLYTAVHRTNGVEYIFLNNLTSPVAERFTLHFTERYKERHLRPRGIDTGAMPVPLYFQVHNPDCIQGRYYKTTDLDIEEGKHKRFWIAPEGIYVTDCIEGMLTYITFMDKDDLSPLKKQVYEEEIVWDATLRILDEKRSMDERIKAAYSIAYNPEQARIFERFVKRNVIDEGDGEKQRLMKFVREKVAELDEGIRNTKIEMAQREKDLKRKHKLTAGLSGRLNEEDMDIPEYLKRMK